MKIAILLPLAILGVFSFKSLIQADTQTKDYIVVYKDSVADVDSVTNNLEKIHGFSSDQRFSRVVKGFSASLNKDKLNRLTQDNQVKYVVEDKPVHTFGQITPTGVQRIAAPQSSHKGSGVSVAVVDTGIDLKHPDLSANIIASKSCLRYARTGNDDNGHGSHVAGTIAALDNSQGVVGVASASHLAAVKVLNSSGSGTFSSIICGLDWVTSNTTRYNIKVINMSLGGSGSSDNNCGNTNSDPLHQAICRTRDAGITVVVAAGNSSSDTSTTVPAAYDDAVITVSALADSDGTSGGNGPATSYGADDTFANFSNYGSAVDLGAPGVNIYSTYKDGGYATLSGTSMATPHVSAAAAIYLSIHPGSSWSQVRDNLKTLAEPLGSGHTDPSGRHPEPITLVNQL